MEAMQVETAMQRDETKTYLLKYCLTLSPHHYIEWGLREHAQKKIRYQSASPFVMSMHLVSSNQPSNEHLLLTSTLIKSKVCMSVLVKSYYVIL